MKLRTLLMAALLVGGFVYLTSLAHWNPAGFLHPGGVAAGRLWSGPEVVQSAGLG